MSEVVRIEKPEPKPRKVTHKGSRNKGARLERAVAKSMGGKRTPLSGANGGGDVIADGFSIECKSRAELPALVRDAFKQAKKDIAIGDNRKLLVVLKADREEPIYCMKESEWLQMRDEHGPDASVLIRDLARGIQKLGAEIEKKAR